MKNTTALYILYDLYILYTCVIKS